MTSAVEQRKHPRVRVNFEGIVSTDTIRNERVAVLDLSLGGCRVASTTYVPPDAVVELQIRPHEKAPLHFPGAMVRWVQGAIFGVQFARLTEPESRMLTDLLSSLSH